MTTSGTNRSEPSECDHVELVLADVVSGELKGAEMERVERHVASCDACRERIEGLRGALSVVSGGTASADEAGVRTASVQLPGAAGGLVSQPRRVGWRGVLAAAAVIAVSFGLGYVARGPGTPGRAVGPKDATSGEVLADRYARLARERPEASGMSLALLTIARR
ncbi:MAG: zf-HC2 domain-containing protein [Phycisphaeraceae bacterium]|nr:zf-HC2 domain-containing protein [Phycisphaeraceae bacterium]